MEINGFDNTFYKNLFQRSHLQRWVIALLPPAWSCRSLALTDKQWIIDICIY